MQVVQLLYVGVGDRLRVGLRIRQRLQVRLPGGLLLASDSVRVGGEALVACLHLHLGLGQLGVAKSLGRRHTRAERVGRVGCQRLVDVADVLLEDLAGLVLTAALED